MQNKLSAAVLATAALVAFAPVPALTQDTVNTADPYVATQPVEDDDEFPWGLLGLLGLAGLLGRKRRDEHVHIDTHPRP